MFDKIYPKETELNKTNASHTEALFLNLNESVSYIITFT